MLNLENEERKLQMRTSKEYMKNLNNKIITKEMLGDCLYSVNKRAKNARDKEREYRYDYKYYNDVKYRAQKESYYNMKDKLLKLVTPTCIHEEKQLRKIRVYDYEDAYHQYSPEEIIYSNSFYDRELQEWVNFINVMASENKYYLFYDFGDYSFHTPIDSPEQYPDMNVIEISQLITHGRSIEDLISVQFVKRVVDLVKSGEYTYVA